MSKTLKAVALAVVLVGCAGVVTAASHEEQPNIYVWINFLKALPGQEEALVELLMKDAETFDPLVDSGKAIDWGIAMPATHRPGDSGVRIQWISFVGWSGADAFMAAFGQRMAALSEDERKAMSQEWMSIVEHGSHFDQIDRSVHIGNPEAVASPAYIHLGYWRALPGADAVQVYKEKIAPVFDGVMADGAIQNYGLHVPDIHHEGGWDMMSWYMSANLAARDAVSAAIDGAMAEAGWMDAVMGAFQREHEDQILMVVHHKSAGSGDD